jgi:hypothetical protein
MAAGIPYRMPWDGSLQMHGSATHHGEDLQVGFGLSAQSILDPLAIRV